MEYNEKTDLWIDLAPSQTMIFWPDTNSMEICVKFKDSKTQSHSFFIASQHKTVLRMDKGVRIDLFYSKIENQCIKRLDTCFDHQVSSSLVEQECS